ncbi:hypothetical protein B0H14DRAFT_1351992 [Mycena olivaceomarginata]|nr:hypothetical protein B0H14DRAFT_1351992 [Mycena olivaceomarginata]
MRRQQHDSLCCSLDLACSCWGSTRFPRARSFLCAERCDSFQVLLSLTRLSRSRSVGHSSATPPRARPQVVPLRSRPWCPQHAYPSAAGDIEASSGRHWRLWQRWIALHGGDDTYRRGNSIPMLSCRTPSLSLLFSDMWPTSVLPLATRYHSAQSPTPRREDAQRHRQQ